MDIKKIIKVPYYYVGECPNCGGVITGRYVRTHRVTDNEWITDEALKNGELVRTVPEVIGANCFCLECGEDFSYPVQMKLYSLSEIKEEKLKRHTNELLAERINDDFHKKAKGPLGFFLNFMGKL